MAEQQATRTTRRNTETSNVFMAAAPVNKRDDFKTYASAITYNIAQFKN